MTSSHNSAWKTRESLLVRVKNPEDERSWEDFVYYYKPFIYSIVRNMSILHHDAEEIVQSVLVKAWNKLPKFEYDPERGRFRGWLCQVTGNTVRDFLRREKASIAYQLSSTGELSEDTLGARLPEIEKIAENEWRGYISRHAWKNISVKFKSQVSEAFLLAAQKVPVDEVAQKLGISESSVYVYKSRVQKELRSEIIRLNRILG